MNEENDKKPFFSKISDRVKIAVLRFWLVGLIYYLIGFGTDLGAKEQPYDLIFVLAIVIGACHVILFNPIMYKMFDIERNGKIINKKIEERKVWQGVLLNLLEILKCFVVVILVYLTYQLINYVIYSILQLTGNILPVEPILFGLFYMLYYELFTSIKNKIILIIEKKRGE